MKWCTFFLLIFWTLQMFKRSLEPVISWSVKSISTFLCFFLQIVLYLLIWASIRHENNDNVKNGLMIFSTFSNILAIVHIVVICATLEMQTFVHNYWLYQITLNSYFIEMSHSFPPTNFSSSLQQNDDVLKCILHIME